MSPLQQRDLFEQAQSVYFTRQWKLDPPLYPRSAPLLPSLPRRENDFYFISVFLIFLFSFMFFLITSSLFIPSRISWPVYTSACFFLFFFFFFYLCAVLHLYPSPLFFFFFFLPFGSFPYRSIKHSFYPLLSDVSPSTSIHLLLTLSLPFPSLSPPDSPPSLHPSPPQPPLPPPPHSLSQPFTPFFCTWDLPNNKWLCPRSDKRSTAQEATATVSFIPFFFFPPLSPHSFRIISAAHNNNYWGRQHRDKNAGAEMARERERGREKEKEREREEGDRLEKL